MLSIDFTNFNIWAVLICAFLTMLSGSLWYNPKTFFIIWWKGIGKSDKDVPGNANMGLVWSLTALSSIIQPLLFAVLLCLVFPEGASAWSGLQFALLLWLAVVAPMYLVNKLFAGHGLKVWAIETGNHLLNLILFGLIIGSWQ
jgi:hypothetical protein